LLDKVFGASTIVDYDAPPVDYKDDANRHERGQPTLKGTDPPPLPRVASADLQFPNKEGEISVTDDDDEEPEDEDYTYGIPTNFRTKLNQEHTITAVSGIIVMANAMATQEEEILEEEDNDGEMYDQLSTPEGVYNIEELQQQLMNQLADVEQHIRMLQEASDSNT
jgi:hypothetical protein